MRLILAGLGMGDPEGLTAAAAAALAEAEVVLGSERLLAGLPPGLPGRRLIPASPGRAAELVREHPEWGRVVLAVSGDVGFHSGARRLLALLEPLRPEILCGLSTPQYFAARLRRPWQSFRLVSAHGREADPLAEALNHREVFFLAGAPGGAAGIIRELCRGGLDRARVTVGERLSLPDERITAGTAGELASLSFADPAALLVENESGFRRAAAAPGIPDGEFIRGDAPLTKLEIRVQALALLGIRPEAILYDLGSGTGSVGVEMALLARRGRVYALERDPARLALTRANREKFGVRNLIPVAGSAPEALAELPPPAAAFLGGGHDRLRETLAVLKGKNPAVRLAIPAITLETLTAALACLEELGFRDIGAVQIAVNRLETRGGARLLLARNPVFLVSGGGPDG
ncbi:MAG: precorrin-6y C5,15-methyltransferase (decarboxylating) subunit CbiE [Planctomycetota bacterium]|jgi:precorrin-6Y C5,15-methyltransferase (decarboxylating)|nr:precorrin-6y C5,15-methyltransferase (decarboxylating) subunit CbiE [Planctomycetota bacterium]